MVGLLHRQRLRDAPRARVQRHSQFRRAHRYLPALQIPRHRPRRYEERGDIDERGGIANGVVLVLVVHLVDADGVIARPLAIAQAFAQRQSALMKGSSDRHDSSVLNVAEIAARTPNYRCEASTVARREEAVRGMGWRA